MELYGAYGTVIYWRCHRLLGDPAAAEDATQETFLRVHRHLDRAPDDEALRWIFRIATNWCLNEIRDRRRRPEPQAAPPERADPGFAAHVADRDLVNRIIDEMPEKLRDIAWLHLVDGIEQGEVARILGVSRRTVINRLAELTERAQRFARRTA